MHSPATSSGIFANFLTSSLRQGKATTARATFLDYSHDVLGETGKSAWEMREEGVTNGGDMEDIVKGIVHIMLNDTAAMVEEVDGMQVK